MALDCQSERSLCSQHNGNKIHEAWASECKTNDAGNNCTSLMLSAKYELQTGCNFKCHIFKHMGESHKPVNIISFYILKKDIQS